MKLFLFRLIILTLISLLASPTHAQTTTPLFGNETPEQKANRMAWWKQDRFGMFIHFGLYAMPARGFDAWVKTTEKQPDESYDRYFKHFNPERYDPKEWARQAKAAGMKYVVMTTKHHDGFCLFDSKYTDYKSTNTPFGRDLIKEYVDACRAEGLKVGFYYSIIDWHHPDFPVEAIHPLRPGNFPPNQTLGLLFSWFKNKRNDRRYAALNKDRDMAKYREYMFNQVTELLTNYGKIDVVWFDFLTKKNGHRLFSSKSYYGKGPEDYHSAELLKLVKKLQPNIIINDRLGLGEGDFKSPEQVSSKKLKAYRGRDWETCQTFSGAWGYHKGQNAKWKSDKELIRLLVTSVANGGNLLLNVGPTALGEFDYRAKTSLGQVSKWMDYYSKAIYGCTSAPNAFKAPQGSEFTYNPDTKKLYVHLLARHNQIRLKGFRDKLLYAELMHDKSEVEFSPCGKDVILKMKRSKINSIVPVIELYLK